MGLVLRCTYLCAPVGTWNPMRAFLVVCTLISRTLLRLARIRVSVSAVIHDRSDVSLATEVRWRSRENLLGRACRSLPKNAGLFPLGVLPWPWYNPHPFSMRLYVGPVDFLERSAMSRLTIFMTVCLGAGAVHGQTVVYVDVTATGTNNGSSWCDAYVYLQDALAAAGPSTEIRVAQGIYRPDQGAGQTPSDREATFQLLDGVALRGGYAGCGGGRPRRAKHRGVRVGPERRSRSQRLPGQS